MTTAMATRMEVALDSSRAWSAKPQRNPMEVEVLQGTVFLTVEGDLNDHIISAGDVFQGPVGRRIAAMGLSPSRIRVSGTKGSLEWHQERPTRLTFKPIDFAKISGRISDSR